jgi:hypothetical protein
VQLSVLPLSYWSLALNHWAGLLPQLLLCSDSRDWCAVSLILPSFASACVQRAAVWYQLLLASLDDSSCRDALLDQEVLQQLQQGGQNSRAMQLGLDEARMRAQLAGLQREFRKQLKKEKAGFYWAQEH